MINFCRNIYHRNNLDILSKCYWNRFSHVRCPGLNSQVLLKLPVSISLHSPRPRKILHCIVKLFTQHKIFTCQCEVCTIAMKRSLKVWGLLNCSDLTFPEVCTLHKCPLVAFTNEVRTCISVKRHWRLYAVNIDCTAFYGSISVTCHFLRFNFTLSTEISTVVYVAWRNTCKFKQIHWLVVKSKGCVVSCHKKYFYRNF